MFLHSHKKRKDSLETRVELTIQRTYVGSNCAIIRCNLSKKLKLALYQAQSGEPNYLDYKILFEYFARGYLHNNFAADIQIL